MKNIISLFILTFLTTTVFAQNKERDIEVYFQVAPFATINPSKDLGLISILGIEYFLGDKLSIATNFYSSNNTLIKNDSVVTIHSYGLMATSQYYFINFKKMECLCTSRFGIWNRRYKAVKY